MLGWLVRRDSSPFWAKRPKFTNPLQYLNEHSVEIVGRVCIPSLRDPERRDITQLGLRRWTALKISPACHFGVENQLPWLEINDDLPRIRTEDDPELAACWTAVGQPKSGPTPGPAEERRRSRLKDVEE